MSHKNHQALSIVLTTGDYTLQFFDVSNKVQRANIKALTLDNIPLTLNVEAYPIMQNTERSPQCEFMYMHPNFLLQRFPERKRYHFEDKILVNLKDLKQTVNLEFEAHHSVKVAL
jgi:hypothetical protein